MNFKEFGLMEPIIKAITENGYEKATPIQEQAIPIILEGNDILGCAQTGTGKTAAFALPLIHKLEQDNSSEQTKKIKALILTPTRELAIQIRDSFRDFEKYTKLKCSVIFGGVNQKSQMEVLKKGVDIVVATPGRLLDLMNQGYVRLENLNYLVLDEADTMLDMGFIHDIKKIVAKTPDNRQTLLFSATMPTSIEALASSFLKNPKTVKVTPVSSTVEAIDQSLYYVDKKNKPKLLVELLNKEDVKSALIFTRTKHGANKLGDILKESSIPCSVIHGNKSQNARVQALNHFKSGKTKALIATDIAARGIDINELSHVFNFEMPDQAETYVHRIGRTGRAGFDGTAISLCNIDEKTMVKEVEKLTKQPINVIDDHYYPMVEFALTPKKSQNKGTRGATRNVKQSQDKPKKNSYKPSFGGEVRGSKFRSKGQTGGKFRSSRSSGRGR